MIEQPIETSGTAEQAGACPDRVPEKRFFHLDDDGCIWYLVVARDLEHAKQTLREVHCLFGPAESPMDAADTLTWTEMDAARVSGYRRCATQDDRGVIALADAEIGDWFSSEW